MGKMLVVLALAVAMSVLLSGCAQKAVPEGMTSDGRAYRGASDAKLVIYEYSDFECPYCAKVQPVVEQVMQDYQAKVRLEFRHYPLVAIHPYAYDAAVASVCAERQGKFWQMHDKLYESQLELQKEKVVGYASAMGLDMEKFNSCMGSSDARSAVDKDIASAPMAGVQATPTFVIGKSILEGAQPYDKFRQVIDAELAKAG